jgi:hypothetical protein
MLNQGFEGGGYSKPWKEHANSLFIPDFKPAEK